MVAGVLPVGWRRNLSILTGVERRGDAGCGALLGSRCVYRVEGFHHTYVTGVYGGDYARCSKGAWVRQDALPAPVCPRPHAVVPRLCVRDIRPCAPGAGCVQRRQRGSIRGDTGRNCLWGWSKVCGPGVERNDRLWFFQRVLSSQDSRWPSCGYMDNLAILNLDASSTGAGEVRAVRRDGPKCVVAGQDSS